MGEIADSMIDGDSCQECGVCFEVSHGFPVLCGDCWNAEFSHRVSLALKRGGIVNREKIRSDMPQMAHGAECD